MPSPSRQHLEVPAEVLAAPGGTSKGIPATPENLAKAKDALNYQPWQTVWESASAIVATTAKTEYEAMLKKIFASRRVHLIAGERSVDGWNVPEWARRAAASTTVIPDADHMMMLEQPDALGASIDKLLQPGASIPFSTTPS